MRKLIFTLSIGFVGARHREVYEVLDDSTDEEIEELWKEWAWDKIDGNWFDEDDE